MHRCPLSFVVSSLNRSGATFSFKSNYNNSQTVTRKKKLLQHSPESVNQSLENAISAFIPPTLDHHQVLSFIFFTFLSNNFFFCNFYKWWWYCCCCSFRVMSCRYISFVCCRYFVIVPIGKARHPGSSRRNIQKKR